MRPGKVELRQHRCQLSTWNRPGLFQGREPGQRSQWGLALQMQPGTDSWPQAPGRGPEGSGARGLGMGAWPPGRPTEGPPPSRHGQALVGLAGLPPMCHTPAPRAWCRSGSLLDGCWLCGRLRIEDDGPGWPRGAAGKRPACPVGASVGMTGPFRLPCVWEQRTGVATACSLGGAGTARGPTLLGVPGRCTTADGLLSKGFFAVASLGREHSGGGGGAGIGAVGWRLSYEGFQRPSSASVIINGCDNSCGNFLSAHRPRAATLGLIESWLQPEGLTCPWGHRDSRAHEA